MNRDGSAARRGMTRRLRDAVRFTPNGAFFFSALPRGSSTWYRPQDLTGIGDAAPEKFKTRVRGRRSLVNGSSSDEEVEGRTMARRPPAHPARAMRDSPARRGPRARARAPRTAAAAASRRHASSRPTPQRRRRPRRRRAGSAFARSTPRVEATRVRTTSRAFEARRRPRTRTSAAGGRRGGRRGGRSSRPRPERWRARVKRTPAARHVNCGRRRRRETCTVARGGGPWAPPSTRQREAARGRGVAERRLLRRPRRRPGSHRRRLRVRDGRRRRRLGASGSPLPDHAAAEPPCASPWRRSNPRSRVEPPLDDVGRRVPRDLAARATEPLRRGPLEPARLSRLASDSNTAVERSRERSRGCRRPVSLVPHGRGWRRWNSRLRNERPIDARLADR